MKNIRHWTILGVLSLGITCSIAYSSTSKASSGLQSKGKLVYQDPVSQQEVIMDANDHTILKGSIDANSGQILSLKEFQAQQETLNQELQQKDTELENGIQDINNNLGGLRFGVDGEGNYGYFGADDSLIPFSSTPVPLLLYYVSGTNHSSGYDYVSKSHLKQVLNITIDNDFINIKNNILTAKRNIMIIYANADDTAESKIIKKDETHSLSISAYTSIMVI